MDVPARNPLDLVHYATTELDILPQALRPIAPAYPYAAFAARSAGFATLLVSIDETGRVTDTAIVDTAPGGMFAEAAQHAVASVAFSPAQKDGRMVRSRILLRIEFDPDQLNAAH